MIDETAVENIKKTGVFKESAQGRLDVLARDIGFRMDQPAEYVLIGGCFQPEAMPDTFRTLKNLLEQLQVDYTMLSKEYCCGWMPIGQPAVMSKSEDDILKFKELSKDFILQNFRQAEALGAKYIALFCAACEPNYSNYSDATELKIISYTELLERHFKEGKLDLAIDYYAGCYRFRRRITQKPLDVEPATRLLKKIKGLKVNVVDSKLCCYIPPHLEQLLGGLVTDNLVTICTGCYHNLRAALQDKKGFKVKMLPELVLDSMLTR